jgi:hypothetical protein
MFSYDETHVDEIAALFIGRRIVSAEMGSFDYPGQSTYDRAAEGRLVLDDGTMLYLSGHEGGCSCGAGDYDLSNLSTADNTITSARVDASPAGDDLDGEGRYSIFVLSDNAEINVAEFTGTDGNGYYGTGFYLTVVPAQ